MRCREHRVSGLSVAASPAHIAALSEGNAHRFSDWPNPEVPRFGAGVYTIWHRDGRFIYVGMSGRGITAATPPRNSPHGLYTRLHSHWGGRRSGDQFCIYVADRFVLPTLSREDIASIASGRHEMDALVRRYIHMSYCIATSSCRTEKRRLQWRRRSSRALGVEADRS
jgi:hypothetical protein